MTKKRVVEVVKESDSGRNQIFRDTGTGRRMPRPEFVEKIKEGVYPDYHVRKVNGVPTPASNPDGNSKNNLG